MSRPIQFNNHPFRFLLYLEWVLLAIAVFTAALPSPSPRFNARFPELTIFSLIIFGIMGLRLPTSNYLSKIIYTTSEIFLIVTTGFFGGRVARLFPFLYIILVTRSCLIFQLPGRLLVTSISFSLFLLTLQHRFPKPPLPPYAQERFRFFPLSLALIFGLSLIFILLLMNTVISERQSREKLAIANEKLRQYALKIENQATLEERNRIAREIHDSLGHSLTALNLQLETALKLWQSHPVKAQAFLARAKELGSKSLNDVRQSVSTMRYNPLQGQTLEQAIASLLEDFHRSNGISPTCHINLEYSLPSDIIISIYRIIQESLTNISKYAIASEVKLEITTNKGSFRLIIEDNGKGFDIMQNTTGFGLQSMRDRTLALGGEFQINSTPGSGCEIIVNIPLLSLTR
ncbi:sensor histidine kinase [Nodularia spumigena CS-584]|uniref:histidine kinase n=1 Tax=Nodularia spumigena UHCC 0039 TaxID=1914872 RepID=A0A2S0QB49_NODSP|nr:sensor histidine kinase [Nodularia spumigena]AHJ29055.1 Periplasmic Sensor Signal Transduction Histidine Kinase [Nodularia spumigena CCY9414]AVZ31520.1 sensor histidine kinase LiaS [Nodularia spumigena UHCC 0039]EAW44306.1 Periplasmic Sensor Signal Transduction Histidine Kinase [Nodularia spumigena CCY9414]MDB9384782.1 sensor histidine kinase [Nodularia spumigena CS-584]